MNRLTKDDVKEMGMLELSHNQVFVKNCEAWHRDFEREVSARDLAREMFARNGIEYPLDTGEFDEYMLELLQDGYETIDGMIALYYNALWAFAEVRESLKAYEDTGLTPEEFIDLQVCLEDEGDVGGTIRDLIELMQYRKLEAENRLIKFPFEVGATVFCIDNTGTKRKPQYEVKEYTVDGYTIGTEIGMTICSKDNEWKELCCIEDIGKSIFKTYEEAEKALENND